MHGSGVDTEGLSRASLASMIPLRGDAGRR